jgi:hypothetical protein
MDTIKEEVSRTEPSPSVSIPWVKQPHQRVPAQSFLAQTWFNLL